jgi:hypothetical protein
MIVHFNDANDTALELLVDDRSYRYRAIRGEHSLTLYYSLPEHVEVPLGAWCEFQGERYTLESPQNFKKHNTRNFEYTLAMEAAQAKLKKYKLRDTGTRKLKFNLTAKPAMHLQMLVDNLNRRDAGWSTGECVDAVEKVVSYSHASCLEALEQLAEAFETEWEVAGKTIHLRKVEYNKDTPLPLSYGRGNGFKSGVGRSSGAMPAEALFVQGGERNIDASKYGSAELLLPKGRQVGYDGKLFSDQAGYSAAGARLYVTDDDGFSLQRADKPLSSQVEDSLDCSHIYPSRVGTVSAVTVVNAGNHFYDFTDSSIPANLNYADCLIEGETMTVTFQSGILSGKEFEVKYVHSGRRFEIVPQELDGRTMPDDVFKPAVGDTYAVFGMMMPEAYICDNATKSGASWDMLREAVKYLYENEEQKFTFTGELDGIWAKKDWLNIGGRVKLGGYILFSDNQFQPDGALIRIVGIKDYINNPHSPTVELSNDVVGGSIVSNLRKVESNEVVTEELHRNALQFAKRRFRDAQETSRLLEEAMLANFTKNISPVSVQTMQLLAGDESLQFFFVDYFPSSNSDVQPRIAHEVTCGADKVVRSTFPDRSENYGVLQHMTVGITDVKQARAPTEYRYWAIPSFASPPLDNPEKSYYLYAKCYKSEGRKDGSFVLSEAAIGMEAVDGYYHFLVAIINSECNGERSVAMLYGFTEILPGRITTDRIVSTDGSTYFDLANSEVAGRINFKDGVVSGDIGIGNANGVNAGMSGAGNTDSDIRLWAGATKENRAAAPFRVLHDGSLFASKANVKGAIEATSGKFTGEINATSGKFKGEIEAISGKMDSITATNLTVDSGTFKGVINAEGGIQLKTRILTVSKNVVEDGDSFVFITSLASTRTITLPSTPPDGQMLTIKNESGEEAIIYGNGKRMFWGGEDEGTNGGINYKYNILLAYRRTKQLIYNNGTGSSKGWHVVGQYDF